MNCSRHGKVIGSSCGFSEASACSDCSRKSSIVASSAHYEDLCIAEPEAPTFSLGERVQWPNGCDTSSGTIRWIGRIPQLYHGWSVGVEFDLPVRNGGDGCFGRRRYFHAPADHSLFLPSEDLQPAVAEESCTCRSNGCHCTSYPGDQEVTCSHYVPLHRDSECGQLRNCCHCSFCTWNNQQCGGQRCESGPVYGRISIRQSLKSAEHPYESYVAHSPPERRLVQSQSHTYSPVYCARQDDTVAQFPEHASTCKSQRNSKSFEASRRVAHSMNRVTPVDLRYKESFFSPRSTIKLINGLKEWVSCWVLGTSRRNKKRNIVVKGRKTVTSLIVSDPLHSMSRTGQRLSSFSDYSPVEPCTLTKSGSSRWKSSDEVRPLSTGSRKADKALPANSAATSKRRCRQYKKRPAPPPPQSSVEVHLQVANENESSPSQSISKKKERSSNRSNEIAESLKTSEKKVKVHSRKVDSESVRRPRPGQQLKKSSKKYRAPVPPNNNYVRSPDVRIQTNSTPEMAQLNFAVDSKESNCKFKVVQSQHLSLKIGRKDLHSVAVDEENDDDDDGWVMIPSFNKTVPSSFNRDNASAYDKLIDEVVYADNSSESEPENSIMKRHSLTFSADDSEGEIASGITSYWKTHGNNDESYNYDVSSHFSKRNDKCLKISIAKTEMNVLTVEELSQSSDGEDGNQSALSELSENDLPESGGKIESSLVEASRTSSPEESPPPLDTKPIFDELRLTPPSKASVKDFVNAFNMLADRTCHSDLGSKRQSLQKLPPKVQSVVTENTCPATGNCIQSFPTKWQYQGNGSSHSYQSNNFLLPIEEESHNDLTEQEADPVRLSEASNFRGSKPKCKASVSRIAGNFQLHDSAPDTVDYIYTSKHDKNITLSSLQEKAEIVPQNKNNLAGNTQVTRASTAALSALLNAKAMESKLLPKGDGLKAKGSFSKTKVNNDQPIVVNLFIEDKSSHRGPMPFMVKPSMSLWKLKKKVEKEYNFDKDLQCWILGETFAIHDEASLASYGVCESGCPILLYVMTVDSKSRSLPFKSKFKSHRTPFYDDVPHSSSESEADDVENLLDREVGRSHRRSRSSQRDPKTGLLKEIKQKTPQKHPRLKGSDGDAASFNARKSKSPYHAAWEKDAVKKKDYHALIELDDVDLVKSRETFECPICFLDVPPGDGAVLQDCLHSFCRECLSSAVEFSNTAMIKCPFRNDEYSCESHLQEREIKSLVTPVVFERHLQRSMALAESQAQDSFHCKTPDCHGWCLYEDNVNTFLCPVCKHTNCLTCAAVHEGKNCRQYQDDAASRCDSSEEAKKTKEYLENMVKDGEAMKCPKCEVILMKKWGCDWLKCSMCHTEVCWVTKGPRWGPGGRGDTSGGCKCMLNGVRCHPKCSYCH